ncbi:hypothetical protein Bca52824_035410 [Brassica carinata]|uniref:Uncharacterized protein n=1 Tax=Brassica carinata TaxID=52824 RepID=A0A8X7S467_BRACI|nr:hypothetical protein Bca52824_035410 [Brassica carinata]
MLSSLKCWQFASISREYKRYGVPTNPAASPRIPAGLAVELLAVETRPADCYVILLVESQLLKGLTLLKGIVVAASRVIYSKKVLETFKTARAMLINAGQANAATWSEDPFKGVKLSKEDMQTSFASDTTNKGSFRSVSSGKASSVVDNVEPIDIKGQEETGISKTVKACVFA